MFAHDLSRIFSNLNYIKARSLKTHSSNQEKLDQILECIKKSKNVFIVNELGHDTFKFLITNIIFKSLFANLN